jgi:hypothetical protein
MEKKCNKCKEVKPVSEFMKEARAKNGYKPRCKVCINEYDRLFYQKRKDKKIAQTKIYYEANRGTISERNRLYKKANRPLFNKRGIEYVKKRKEVDPYFKYMLLLRAKVSSALRSNSKATKALVGFTKDELICYLGKKPTGNETLDHKIPISWFKQYADIKIMFDLRNTQILTREENTKKLNRYADVVPKDYFDIAILHIKDEYKNKISYE